MTRKWRARVQTFVDEFREDLRARAKGVPWWSPFEIHLPTKEELSLLEGAKLVRVL